MPRLDIYEQQTVAQGPRASGLEFGAGIGQAMQQAGSVMEDIGVTMKRREDVIDRVRLTGEFEKFAGESLTALEGEDLANKATVDKYSQGVREKVDQIVGMHGGTSASRAELKAQLLNQAVQYEKSARAGQVKAQHTLVGNFVEQQVNALSSKATIAPDVMGDTFAEFDNALRTFEGVMSPQVIEQYRTSGREKIAQGAINGLLARGQWQKASDVMNNPEVIKVLSPDVSRKLRIDVMVDEGNATAETKRQEDNIRRLTLLTGRDLSPEEQTKAGLLPPKKDRTPADEIAELEIVKGRPATQTEVDKIFGTYVDGGSQNTMFGNSLEGRAISFVTENAAAYANGMLTSEQARQFESSVAVAYGPKQDPVTGNYYTPTKPAFVAQAVNRGGSMYGGTMQAPAGQPIPPGQQAMPGQTVQLDIGGRPIGQGVVGPNGEWTIPAPPESGAAGGIQPAPVKEPTIWEMAESMSGPGAAVAASAEGMPIIGGRLGPAVGEMLDTPSAITTNRQYVRTQISQMVDALSINPRNPVALVEMIRKELDVDPKVMDNPAAYRKRLEGVNRALTERLIEETNAGNNPDLPAKTRQDALTVADSLRNFQKKLMPPMVKNRAEIKQLGLKSGDKFVDPSGKLRMIP